MDKRYQVFVSSTYKDLESYGSIGPAGVSYTEMEYDYALANGKPILPFLFENPSLIPAGLCEDTPKGRKLLSAFRKKIQDKYQCKYWNSPADLGGKVSRGIVTAIASNPMPGWIRTSEILSAHEIRQLTDENTRLKFAIANSGVLPPEGSNLLAQGNQEIELLFNCEFYDSGEGVWGLREYTTTWDSLFEIVGKTMVTFKQGRKDFEEMEENDLVNSRDIISAIADDFKKRFGLPLDSYGRCVTFWPNDRSIEAIKSQFVGLGLVQVIEENSVVHGMSYVWKFTPLGRSYYRKLTSKKK